MTTSPAMSETRATPDDASARAACGATSAKDAARKATPNERDTRSREILKCFMDHILWRLRSCHTNASGDTHVAQDVRSIHDRAAAARSFSQLRINVTKNTAVVTNASKEPAARCRSRRRDEL